MDCVAQRYPENAAWLITRGNCDHPAAPINVPAPTTVGCPPTTMRLVRLCHQGVTKTRIFMGSVRPKAHGVWF